MATGTAKIKHEIVSMSVDLGVTTPDKLRHVAFGLEKNKNDDGTISWTIDFKLQERAKVSEQFSEVVSLKVKVKSKNNAAAEATAKEGLSDAQSDHLMGPGTIAANKLKEKTATEEQVSRVIEGTLAKHDE